MGINFPSSPADGQVLNVSPGVSFVASGGRWLPAPLKTALPKNYLVNSTMSVSQQYGTTATAITGASYALDQWKMTSAGGTPGFTTQQLALVTPFGSPYRMRATLTNVGTGTGRYVLLLQSLEGQRVAELRYGSASAKSVVALIGLRSSVAATYDFILRNLAINQIYVAPFTIAAGQINTDLYFTFAIPGCTTGAWPTDNTLGFEFGINVSAGPAAIGGLANGWSATLFVSLGTSTVNAVIDLFDCALYADPYQTGVAPPFVVPDFATELTRCKRYWYKANGLSGCATGATTIGRAGMRHPVPMRTTPAGTVVGAPKFYDGQISTAATSLSSVCNPYAAEFDVTCAGATFTAGRASQMIWLSDNDYIAMNARM